jgi:uncharacterized protein
MLFSKIMLCLGIGVVSGIVAALCGVGGGVIMVPAFVGLLDLPHKTAVATSLAIIIPTAMTATVQNARHGLVDWRVAAITALAAAFFSYFGSATMRQLSTESLGRIFGILLIGMGIRILWLGRV